MTNASAKKRDVVQVNKMNNSRDQKVGTSLYIRNIFSWGGGGGGFSSDALALEGINCERNSSGKQTQNKKNLTLLIPVVGTMQVYRIAIRFWTSPGPLVLSLPIDRYINENQRTVIDT